MGLTMKANSRIIKLMAKDFISGVMGRPSKAVGGITSCMGTECLLLKMEGYIKASIRTIRSMVLELLHGLMEDATKVAGKTVNNMEKEPIKVTKTVHPGKECGRMERESNG